jgi:hypothetical protein
MAGVQGGLQPRRGDVVNVLAQPQFQIKTSAPIHGASGLLFMIPTKRQAQVGTKATPVMDRAA